MKLEGKVALVTGSGRGIGQAIAMTFAREGADVAINAAHLFTAENTAEAVSKLGRKAIAIEADVAQVNEVDRMISRTVDELGGIHILVNNAGIGPEYIPTIEQSVELWDKQINIHLRGTYLCSRRAAQWMIEHKTGKILNMSSIMAFGAFPMSTDYGPAKAAIINLTKALAVEWAQYGINVNAIAPGYVSIPRIMERVRQGKLDLEHLKKRIPLRRLAEPEEIAKAALFLVSDDASYITGITMPVDGGWIAYGYL